MTETIVNLGGTDVLLRRPRRKWVRILRTSLGSVPAELWGMACLGMCWRGEDHPADPEEYDPRHVMRYGERVLDELLDNRDIPDADLDAAILVASSMVWGDRKAVRQSEPERTEVERTAAFFDGAAADQADSST